MNFSQKKAKVIGFGLLIYVAWNIGLFGAATVFGFEDVAPPPASDMLIGTLVASVVVGVVAWGSSRLLRLSSQRDRFIAGGVWTAMVIILLLIVTIANDTTSIVFGTWGVYVSFIAIVVGAILGKSRAPSAPPTNSPPA